MNAAYPVEQTIQVRCHVNGKAVTADVSVRTTAADFLRANLQLTGTHVSCEEGQCGACSINVDGKVVRSCVVLAVQMEGTEIRTVEGAPLEPWMLRLQETFFSRGAVQCGFCTAGMLLTAAELLSKCEKPDRNEIRAYLAGNYCRCTGYEAIIDAIEQAAAMGPAVGSASK